MSIILSKIPGVYAQVRCHHSELLPFFQRTALSWSAEAVTGNAWSGRMEVNLHSYETCFHISHRSQRSSIVDRIKSRVSEDQIPNHPSNLLLAFAFAFALVWLLCNPKWEPGIMEIRVDQWSFARKYLQIFMGFFCDHKLWFRHQTGVD